MEKNIYKNNNAKGKTKYYAVNIEKTTAYKNKNSKRHFTDMILHNLVPIMVIIMILVTTTVYATDDLEINVIENKPNTNNVISNNSYIDKKIKVVSNLSIGEVENKKTDNLGIDEVENETIDVDEIQEEVMQTSAKTEEVEVDSRIALIYDRASGRILYEKNGNKQTPMASTTKIMTAIVVLENANLKDVVTINSKAAGMGGSRLGLKKNDKITVNDLLYGLMLRSGNDAAVALAIHVGGSVEGFADMMNEKAKQMGLTNSHFIVPHGLDNEGHFTTAYELAKMADYALKIEKFRQIVGTKTTTIYINGYAKSINNTNQLLGSVAGVYGVKTGFTNGAGRCLVSSCKRDDLDIITVIIGADTTKQRTSDTIKLIQYTYNNFEVINIRDIINEKFNKWLEINQGRIYVNKGAENQVKLYLEELSYEKMAIKKDEVDKINIEANCIYYFEAPIYEKQVIGNLKVEINNEAIELLEIYNKNSIRKKEIADYLIEFLEIFQKLQFIA